MKKRFTALFLFIFLLLSLSSCNNNNNNSSVPTNTQTITTIAPSAPTTSTPGSTMSSSSVSTTAPTSAPTQTIPTTTPSSTTTPSFSTTTPTQVPVKEPTNKKPTIYLAGDSTVKTYNDNQYIGGWGQFLDDFLSDEIVVKNAAQGGRSSRSFINEGRLYPTGGNYSFKENNGEPISAGIKEGDFLFIQFGHNDDASKSIPSTMADRMVQLGTPDENGIFPIIPGQLASTSYIPEEVSSVTTETELNNAKTEIAKYGDNYYPYGSGTYKWYLKKYIDFARSVGAIPVLVTPVSRVKFSGNEIIGGPGLHGENFAYVQAVRQLASEEDCLLIDLFAKTKMLLETATPSQANYLMAIKPNDLTGTWPAGYDKAYGNSALGYQGIEATHYNKYGAFLTAAFVAEEILKISNNEIHSNNEYFNFSDYVLSNPKAYTDPSNLNSKSTIANLEGLFTIVNPSNPDRVYLDPQVVIDKIASVCVGEVTLENFSDYKVKCNEALDLYNALNSDDRGSVTNYDLLLEYVNKVNEKELESRPKPVKTVIMNPNDLTIATYTTEFDAGNGFIVVGAQNKAVDVKSLSAIFVYNGTEYSNTKAISMGGSASFGSSRYIEFTTEGACTITVVAKSSGSTDRVVNLVSKGSKTPIVSFAANVSLSITSQELTSAGTYQLGSASSGLYILYIIIEYFE